VNRRRVRLGTGDFASAKAPNPYARWLFLMAVERCLPNALQTLAAVDETDAAALDAWAQRWGFTDDWARRICFLQTRDLFESDAAAVKLVTRGLNVRQVGRLFRRGEGQAIDGYAIQRDGAELNAILWRILGAKVG